MKSNTRFNKLMAKAAAELNIRRHVVGQKGDTKELHSAADVEGHMGKDKLFYLLDLSRTFPPESPQYTKHLSNIHLEGSTVYVLFDDETKHEKATVQKSCSNGKFYHVIRENGTVMKWCPSERIGSYDTSYFWRFLR